MTSANQYQQQLLARMKKFLDEATTPEERQLRKRALHGAAYRIGPVKFTELFNMRNKLEQEKSK